MPRSRARTRTRRSAEVRPRGTAAPPRGTAGRAPPPRPRGTSSRSNGPSVSTTARPSARRRARSAARPTGTSVLPKSNVIAAMPPGSNRLTSRRWTGRSPGTGSSRTSSDPASACSRGPASRPPRSRSSRGPSPGACGSTSTRPTSPESRKWSWTAVRQAAGHRLVAHRVDLELERVAGPLAGLGRVADVARLVVGDRDPLAAGQARASARPCRRGPAARSASSPGGTLVGAGSMSTRSQRPRIRSPPRQKLNSRST